MLSCIFCAAIYDGPVYRNTLCPSCGKELKICLNCLYYDPSYANECREPISDPVKEKDRANFCDWFAPSTRSPQSLALKKEEEKDKNRREIKKLFGDS